MIWHLTLSSRESQLMHLPGPTVMPWTLNAMRLFRMADTMVRIVRWNNKCLMFLPQMLFLGVSSPFATEMTPPPPGKPVNTEKHKHTHAHFETLSAHQHFSRMKQKQHWTTIHHIIGRSNVSSCGNCTKCRSKWNRTKPKTDHLCTTKRNVCECPTCVCLAEAISRFHYFTRCCCRCCLRFGSIRFCTLSKTENERSKRREKKRKRKREKREEKNSINDTPAATCDCCSFEWFGWCWVMASMVCWVI